MVDCLSVNIHPEAQIRAIEEYISYLLSMRNSIKTSEVKLKNDVIYSWTSFLSVGGAKAYGFPQIDFETIMTFTAYAYALANSAIINVTDLNKLKITNPSKNVSEVLKESNHLLRKAAGVLEYVGKEIIPGLTTMRLNAAPLECIQAGNEALQQLLLYESQLLSIQIAEESKTPENTIARVAHGCFKMIEKVLNKLKPFCNSTGLKPDILLHLQASRLHIQTILYTYMGNIHLKKSPIECGMAIGFLKDAVNFNKETLKYKKNLGDKIFASPIYYEGMLKEKLGQATYDNNNVYYHTVPNGDMSHFLPEPAEIMKVMTYEIPSFSVGKIL